MKTFTPAIFFALASFLMVSLLSAQNGNVSNNPYSYTYSSSSYVAIDLASPIAEKIAITISFNTTLTVSLFNSLDSSSLFNVPYILFEEPAEGTQKFLELDAYSTSNSWSNDTALINSTGYRSNFGTQYNSSCLFIPSGIGKENLVFKFSSPQQELKEVVIEVTVTP